MVHFLVNMQDLTRIESELDMVKDKTKYVLRAAINKTAKDVLKMLPEKAAREYYIRQTEARKTLEIKSATTAKLEAAVTSRGKVLNLYGSKIVPKRYNPRNRPSAGHTANVKISNRPGNLIYKPGAKDEYKAFVVKYESGHISIARRIPGQPMKEDWLKKKYGWKPKKKNGEPSKKKEALKNLYTSSIPNMLYQTIGGEQDLLYESKIDIDDLLMRNIQEQIQRFVE